MAKKIVKKSTSKKDALTSNSNISKSPTPDNKQNTTNNKDNNNITNNNKDTTNNKETKNIANNNKDNTKDNKNNHNNNKDNNNNSNQTINLIQFISEILVLIGFAIGLIPFMYLISMWWIGPLALLNLILSAVSKNGTLKFTITNFVLTFFAWIPIVGYIPRIVGIVMSSISISRLKDKY